MATAVRAAFPATLSVGRRIKLSEFFRIKTRGGDCFPKAVAGPHTRISEGPVYGFRVIGRK